MRRSWLPPAVVLAAVLAAGCGAEPAPGAADADGDWQLEAGIARGGALPLPAGHRITLTIAGTNLSGTAACNHYGAQAIVAEGSLRIEGIGGTAMGCAPEVMAAESAYLEALSLVRAARATPDRLVLSGPAVELRFVRLEPAPVAAIVGTEWVLETLVQGEVASAPRGTRATLLLAHDGTMSGSTGSRTLTGRYVLRGDELLMIEMAARGEDPPADLAAQDSHIVSVLGDGFTARVEDGRLVLASSGSLGLVYRPATSEP